MENSKKGTIGKIMEDGKPVIYRFVSQIPSEEIRKNFPKFITFSWSYDGGTNNGMPIAEENEKMIAFEDAIGTIDSDLFMYAYSRTGNNLKEFVYFLRDVDKFMGEFNTALAGHPRYPIEIGFFNDENWLRLQEIIDDFKDALDKQ